MRGAALVFLILLVGCGKASEPARMEVLEGAGVSCWRIVDTFGTDWQCKPKEKP